MTDAHHVPSQDPHIEALVAAVAAGDGASWPLLWEAIEPRLLAVLRKPRFLGRLSGRDDEQRDILVEVMARLSADDFRRLRMYLDKRAENPDMRFMSWLIVVAKRVSIDYMRAHDEFVSNRHKGGRGSQAGEWVARGELPPSSRLGDRPPMTRQTAALELMSYAGHVLSEEQKKALSMWVQGEGYGPIGRDIGVDAGDAERLVRSALQRLRRHFRDSRDEEST